MSNTFSIPRQDNFELCQTIEGHGWYDLAPFEYDAGLGTIRYAFADENGSTVSLSISESKGRIRVEPVGPNATNKRTERVIRHILRMDEDYADFYSRLRSDEAFAWVERRKAGRLLRSATVFEDLVKTMCTTNCSWGLTRIMVANLVEHLGQKAPDGKKAFPMADALAERTPDFFRSEIRAGYRSPYLHELGVSVASGKLDPESWLRSDLPTPELKHEIMNVKGIGNYAADNILKLLGRYDGLALDSWLRSGYFKKHNRGKTCTDKKIEKHYRKFGEWQGLAIWCDMTESWFADREQ